VEFLSQRFKKRERRPVEGPPPSLSSLQNTAPETYSTKAICDRAPEKRVYTGVSPSVPFFFKKLCFFFSLHAFVFPLFFFFQKRKEKNKNTKAGSGLSGFLTKRR